MNALGKALLFDVPVEREGVIPDSLPYLVPVSVILLWTRRVSIFWEGWNHWKNLLGYRRRQTIVYEGM